MSTPAQYTVRMRKTLTRVYSCEGETTTAPRGVRGVGRVTRSMVARSEEKGVRKQMGTLCWIAQLHETTYWQSQLSPPPVGVASLCPHYASLKTVMGREEHLKHPVRAVAAAVSQARTGHGKWRICTGARENLPRELRLCLHCDLWVVESVTHSLCVCPLNNDLRVDMVTKLRARICVGLQLTLALPEENHDIWMQVLLQWHHEELGVDFQMSFRALSVAAHADIGAGAPLSPVRESAAETKQQLQIPERSSRRPSRAIICWPTFCIQCRSS